VEHYEGHTCLGARVDVSLSNEWHEQVRRNGTTRSAALCVAQSAREGSRGHHSDGPETTGRRHGAGEFATRDSAPHPGLRHRTIETNCVEETVGPHHGVQC
jgi:hypothetical protein